MGDDNDIKNNSINEILSLKDNMIHRCHRPTRSTGPTALTSTVLPKHFAGVVFVKLFLDQENKGSFSDELVQDLGMACLGHWHQLLRSATVRRVSHELYACTTTFPHCVSNFLEIWREIYWVGPREVVVRSTRTITDAGCWSLSKLRESETSSGLCLISRALWESRNISLDMRGPRFFRRIPADD